MAVAVAPGNERTRAVDNDCLIIPTEGDHVISVSALGKSGRKSSYSNYGLEQTVVSAPGGDRLDPGGGLPVNAPGLRILSSYPRDVALLDGLVDANCVSQTPLVPVDTSGGGCAVYAYLQGTSMAAPHATGVAALIISANGSGSGASFGMSPSKVEKLLTKTATRTDLFFDAMNKDWRDYCPEPPTLYTYGLVDPLVPFDAVCEGNHQVNGSYGYGVVNALEAASS